MGGSLISVLWRRCCWPEGQSPANVPVPGESETQANHDRPVRLEVRGLVGVLCTVEGRSAWTLSQAKSNIEVLTGIPAYLQALCKGTEQWTEEAVTVSDLVADIDIGAALVLTLVRLQDHTVPDDGPLLSAIRRRQEERALEVLQWPSCGLNEDVQFGKTVLHEAIAHDLRRVAVAILKRSDFSEVNSRTANGSTALHWAAFRGFLEVCEAIVARPDFTQMNAESNYFSDGAVLAVEVARRAGQPKVANYLQFLHGI